MGFLKQLLGLEQDKEIPGLAAAIERAVNRVEPHLKQIGGYPRIFRKSIAAALEYSRHLAASVPGPIDINRTTYVKSHFVHALFPSVDFIQEALCASQSMRDFHGNHPLAGNVYALMGMRRWEKTALGMELLGDVVHRDVLQNMVYFTSHTVENPSLSEEETREMVAWSFFDKLIDLVAKRIEARKQQKTDLLREKDWLAARLHEATDETRPALTEEMTKLLGQTQQVVAALDLGCYAKDFEAVLLDPAQYLRIEQTSMYLDDMGVRRESGEGAPGEVVEFNDLIGFDRRQWTVTLVHCSDIHVETYAERLDAAYRRLAI
ncbi:MAG: hypothetical protein KGZ83_11210 [Sulfuricella sp.]|nr:hypothetical protein [Sulfuricella sp.]